MTVKKNVQNNITIIFHVVSENEITFVRMKLFIKKMILLNYEKLVFFPKMILAAHARCIFHATNENVHSLTLWHSVSQVEEIENWAIFSKNL